MNYLLIAVLILISSCGKKEKVELAADNFLKDGKISSNFSNDCLSIFLEKKKDLSFEDGLDLKKQCPKLSFKKLSEKIELDSFSKMKNSEKKVFLSLNDELSKKQAENLLNLVAQELRMEK